MQSAFKQNHSTETLLSSCSTTLHCYTLDVGRNTFLLSLICIVPLTTLTMNFSRAFHSRFGLTDKVLSWIKYCLFYRSEVVSLNGILSNPQPVNSGVPRVLY